MEVAKQPTSLRGRVRRATACSLERLQLEVAITEPVRSFGKLRLGR